MATDNESTLTPRRLGSLGSGIGARHSDVLRLVQLLDFGFANSYGIRALRDRLPRAGAPPSSVTGAATGFSLGMPVEKRFGLMALIGTRKITELIAKAELMRANVELMVPQILVDTLMKGVTDYVEAFTSRNVPANGFSAAGAANAAYVKALADAERNAMRAAAPKEADVRASLAALGAFDLRTQTAFDAAVFLSEGLVAPDLRRRGEWVPLRGVIAEIFYGALPADPDDLPRNTVRSNNGFFVETPRHVQFAASLADKMLIPVSQLCFTDDLNNAQREAVRRDSSFDETKLQARAPLVVPSWVDRACSEIEAKMLDVEAVMRS